MVQSDHSSAPAPTPSLTLAITTSAPLPSPPNTAFGHIPSIAESEKENSGSASFEEEEAPSQSDAHHSQSYEGQTEEVILMDAFQTTVQDSGSPDKGKKRDAMPLADDMNDAKRRRLQ